MPALARLLMINGEDNPIRELWDRLEKIPGGKWVFSKLLGVAAPYSGNIRAHVEELKVGHARVTLRDRPAIRNHLRCVHAIALVNLAEITGNVALGYSLPPDARFIPVRIEIDYLEKARGRITGTSDCPVPETSARGRYEVPVQMWDEQGHEVARARLFTMVGPKV